MIDSSKIACDRWWQKLFVDRINFCHGEFHDGKEKPANVLYDWLYAHWLWPFMQTDCVCCNAVRGLMYGLAIGFIIGVCV